MRVIKLDYPQTRFLWETLFKIFNGKNNDENKNTKRERKREREREREMERTVF